MPFKLKLKKSKQYSVVSKSLCVIAVKLLENSSVECIVSSRTVGQECLSNVCQRLQIQQPEYFGLRYQTQEGALRWVDLERPLKRQLDKYAKECSLYLGVMFYVLDVDRLHNDITRYYYFSHLKCDVIEGRLPCTKEEAIQLASYSLQAEFGDHRPEHHTPDYLKNFVLLPKRIVASEENQEALLEQIVQAHRNLHGVQHALAEVYYILAVQRLDGYGEEPFAVRDAAGNDVVLGVSAQGVTARYRHLSAEPAVYRWDEIVDLVHHKKCFKIEGREPGTSVLYQLEDVPTAKYVWKMCVQQHKFFTSAKESGRTGETFRNASDAATKRPPSAGESPDGAYRTETHDGGSHPLRSSSSDLNGNGPEVQSVAERATDAFGAVDEGRTATGTDETDFRPYDDASNRAYRNVPRGSVELRRALLPSYRRAPDYETAVRTKYGVASRSLDDLSTDSARRETSVRVDGDASRPLLPPLSYSLYGNFADLTELRDSLSDVNDGAARGPTSSAPPAHTYSTPELTSRGGPSARTSSVQPFQFRYKPPPPYPYGQRASSSTPDLTRSNRPLRRAGPDSPSPGATVRSTEVLPTRDGDVLATLDPFGGNGGAVPGSVRLSRTDAPGDAGPVRATYVTVGESWNARVSGVPQGTREGRKIRPYVSSPLAAERSGAEDRPGDEGPPVGPMMMAAMNGLVPAGSRPESPEGRRDGGTESLLESRLEDGQVFLEFERIAKKKPNADFGTALMPENLSRNRFSDVLPYEENRVRLTPSVDNRTGYINASHVSASVGDRQRFYVAAQGPTSDTAESFWQMVWENHVGVVVMLTETRDERGRDRCYQYWPTEEGDDGGASFGEYRVVSKGSVRSPVAVTTSLVLVRGASRGGRRNVWHLRYTDWPDHGCPADVRGFLGFMEEMDSVRRLARGDPGAGNAPVVVHCTAGVGRTGVVILCDILLFCLDHNVPVDVPRVLTLVRMQRMLSVQTLAQYKFVYQVLLGHLHDSRLI